MSQEEIIAPVADNAVAREKRVQHFMTHYNATKEQAEACVTILETTDVTVKKSINFLPLSCKNCGAVCAKGKAILHPVVLGEMNEVGTREILSGEPKIVDCIKCQQCGHSFIHPFLKFFKDNG